MKLNEAKEIMKSVGFRLFKESAMGDVYTEIEDALIAEGCPEEEVDTYIQEYDNLISYMLKEEKSVEEIVREIINMSNINSVDDIDSFTEVSNDIEVSDDMEESCKCKKCGKKKCKCEKELDEDFSEEDLDDEPKYTRAISRLSDAGAIRTDKEQEGTEDWSDFKDEFKTKTAILKLALTPKFMDALIKKYNFEIDAKDIKQVAFKIVESVWQYKTAVDILRTRIKDYFDKQLGSAE